MRTSTRISYGVKCYSCGHVTAKIPHRCIFCIGKHLSNTHTNKYLLVCYVYQVPVQSVAADLQFSTSYMYERVGMIMNFQKVLNRIDTQKKIALKRQHFFFVEN